MYTKVGPVTGKHRPVNSPVYTANGLKLRPETFSANKRLLLERNVQPGIYTDVVASECNKRSSPNNQFHRVSSLSAAASFPAGRLPNRRFREISTTPACQGNDNPPTVAII
ncbi:MAG TPA: hypothetical protein DEB39_07320 [Planctomycetaceae bacterium]|nr:hypothetical protein [Planctomycetaceae bacterium]